jgi:transposase-like protein
VKPVDCVRIVHWMRNALAHVQKGQHTMVAAAIRQAFLQTDAAAAHQTWRHVADQLRPRWPKLAALMDDSEHDVLAYMAFPGQHRTKLHSTNPLEQLNKEVKRRARACPGEGRGRRHLPEQGQYHPADRRRAARTE